MIKTILLRSVLAFLPLFFACTKSDEPASACEAMVRQFEDEASGYFDFFQAVGADDGRILMSENQADLQVEGDFIRINNFTFNLCQIRWYQLDNIGPGRNLIIYL
jgi:hypothetical protein